MGTTQPTTGRTPALQPIVSPVEDLVAKLKLRPNKYPCAVKLSVRGEAKHVDWDFSKAPFRTLELIQITDVQWGSRACRTERVIEYRDWVLSAPNRFMIWTGDNIDAATMQSKGTTWDNTGNPQQQLFEFCELWAPARHRILGYVGGNHERRAITTFGDLGITIAALLRVPYSSGIQHIDVHFGKHQPFPITQWHGSGGARTKGTVAQKPSRFAGDNYTSKLCLMGHLHQALCIPVWGMQRDKQGDLRLVKQIAAMGSSFLDVFGSYAEVAGYAPSDVMMPRCVLEKSGGWEVSLRSFAWVMLSVGASQWLSLTHAISSLVS